MTSEISSDSKSAMPPPPPVASQGAQASTSRADAAVIADATTANQQHASASRASVKAQASTDLISRLEGDLALLLQIMSSSLHYIANRSAHVQLSEAIPLFQPVSGQAMTASRGLLDRAAMAENIEELTDDLLAKAKDMERHIAMLPRPPERVLKDSSSATMAEEMAEMDAPLASRRARRGSRIQSADIDAVQIKAEAESHLHGQANAPGAQMGPDDEGERQVKEELRHIDKEMRGANADFRGALDEARVLKAELDGLLRHVCDEHQQGRAWLAGKAAEEAMLQRQAIQKPSSP